MRGIADDADHWNDHYLRCRVIAISAMVDPSGISIPQVFYSYRTGVEKASREWIDMLTQIQTLLHWTENKRVRAPYMKGLVMPYKAASYPYVRGHTWPDLMVEYCRIGLEPAGFVPDMAFCAIRGDPLAPRRELWILCLPPRGSAMDSRTSGSNKEEITYLDKPASRSGCLRRSAIGPFPPSG